MGPKSIFTTFLNSLGVPYTEEHSDRQFRKMPFKTLFGFSRLLTSYGIPNAAFSLPDKQELARIDTPFLAQKGHTFVVVTDVTDTPDGTRFTYIADGTTSTAPDTEFLSNCTGVVLQAYPDANSREPDYPRHHLVEIADISKRWFLYASLIILIAAGFITSGMWRHLSTIFLSAVNLAGLGVTWLLILKSLKVKSAAADSVCGVLQTHGCDHVLEDKASSFFGIFSWSEVGLAYFSVSTLILFIFPEALPQLALVNACCLPFTVWSIWYQKFRIKTWCTLCVITQTLLWCQFFCYFFGGWWQEIFPLHLSILLIGVAYLGVMLLLNAVCTFIKSKDSN
ncbi:MAG: vitamin K epoxide reductase family protein [Bacteroides sp.]|nr:vitamin K epoxide reductase family protein [Bacteroides sp.]